MPNVSRGRYVLTSASGKRVTNVIAIVTTRLADSRAIGRLASSARAPQRASWFRDSLAPAYYRHAGVGGADVGELLCFAIYSARHACDRRIS
jgi:hypothetical protein